LIRTFKHGSSCFKVLYFSRECHYPYLSSYVLIVSSVNNQILWNLWICSYILTPYEYNCMLVFDLVTFFLSPAILVLNIQYITFALLLFCCNLKGYATTFDHNLFYITLMINKLIFLRNINQLKLTSLSVSGISISNVLTFAMNEYAYTIYCTDNLSLISQICHQLLEYTSSVLRIVYAINSFLLPICLFKLQIKSDATLKARYSQYICLRNIIQK
jgi:hypothetical protein